jgi:hypothetical protein
LFPHRASHITNQGGKASAAIGKEFKSKNFSLYTNNPPAMGIDLDANTTQATGDPLSVSMDLLMAMTTSKSKHP